MGATIDHNSDLACLERSCDSVIEVDSLSFAYPGVKNQWVLNDVSFDVYRGEILGVIGSNGSGKSTLLTLLNGIFSPTRGVIRRKTGRIGLQNLGSGLHGELTGRENSILAISLLGFMPWNNSEILEEIHQFSGLGEHFNMPLKTYSSGMRARLGFSIAMAENNEVILIDEALSVGDKEFKAKSQKKMFEVFSSGENCSLSVA